MLHAMPCSCAVSRKDKVHLCGRCPVLAHDRHRQGRALLMGRLAQLEGGHDVVLPLLVEAAVDPPVTKGLQHTAGAAKAGLPFREPAKV